MVHPRKTADVAAIKDRANRALMVTPDAEVGDRRGIAWLLESILLSTDNYRGFNYLPGHRPMEPNSDETRRFYF